MEDLAQFDLRDGQYTKIPLRWKDSALDRPVFRNVTAQGAQEAVLDKQRFCTFLRQILTMAGYSKRATIHDIRRSLGTKIECKLQPRLLFRDTWLIPYSKAWFCTCIPDLRP